MRQSIVLLVIGLLALLIAGAANAAVLNWSGTLRVSLGDNPEGVLGGGGVATINGSSGVIPAHLSTLRLASSRGHVTGAFTSIVTDPDTLANGVAALVYTEVQGRDGTFFGISGAAASTATAGIGTQPAGGVVKVCLLSTVCTQFFSMILSQPTTVNGVPGTGLKGVGVGGLITAGGYGGIRVSLQGAPWTIKTVTVLDQIDPTTPGGPRLLTTWVAKGWAHAPLSTTTSTAQPGGIIQLVTPNQVSTNLALGSNDKLGSFVVMVIQFIPEPGLLLLLGSGVAGLAVLGRRRIRR
jgi:hypothetical protein